MDVQHARRVAGKIPSALAGLTTARPGVDSAELLGEILSSAKALVIVAEEELQHQLDLPAWSGEKETAREYFRRVRGGPHR